MMEANNAVTIRNALHSLVDVIERLDSDNPLWWHNNAPGVRALKTAKAALAEPILNCEVGTADQQQARHCAWCHNHGIDGDGTVSCAHSDMSCDLCALRWSQMPYEKGSAK